MTQINNGSGPKTFTSTQAKSASVGEMGNMGIQKASFRQVIDNSAAAQMRRFGGEVLTKVSGALSVAFGVMGMNGAAQATNQLGAVGAQVASSGSAGPVVQSTEIKTLGGGLPGSSNPGNAGAVASANAQAQGMGGFGAGGMKMTSGQQMAGTTSNQNTAFGAGAADLGMGAGISSGGAGVSAGVGMSGGLGGSQNPIGAAAGGSSQDQLLNATKQMQETQMSFNLQYLQLQSQMQHENRSYTAISNIMKTKHDTVKNSISNVR